MSYDYDRTKTAGRTPTLSKLLSAWLGRVANQIGAEVPKGLQADGLRVSGGVGDNFALLTANGYSRSDMEATTTVSLTVDYQPFRLRAFAEYKDVMMGANRGAEQEFTLDAKENPVKLAKEIGRWLADR
jgi:hypothetical protein